MIVFLLIFIASYIVAVREVLLGNRAGILIFFIFGLSIYTTSMSVAFTLGLSQFIPLLQSLKEIIVIGTLILSVIGLKQKPRLHLIDYLILAFLFYLIVYAILPIGDQGLFARLQALKSNSFYVLVYFTGRLLDPKTIQINKYFSFLALLAVAAGIVATIEVIFQTPLQFISGYFDYHYYFFNLDADGPFGLRGTFNSDSGYIRFDSFFANPLEHANATIIAFAIILGLYTTDNNNFKFNNLAVMALGGTLLSIAFALSRAPLISYCIMIYVYARITKRKRIVNAVHTCAIIIAIYLVYQFLRFENNQSGLIAVMMNTIDFSDPSSIGHLEQWLEGVLAIGQHPLGMGLGSSGRVAASVSENVGGENQYIIIGVQAGLIALMLYLCIYIMFIRISYKWLNFLKGRERTVCMAVFFIKIGLFISTMSSELESSTYLSYMSWFLSGVLITIIMQQRPQEQVLNTMELSYA